MNESTTKASIKAPLDAEQSAGLRSVNRRAWIVGVLGAALLLACWAYFALPNIGSAGFFLDTLVFLALGAYAFITALNARRETVALEKKLRLSLIMRNMELEGMATRDDLTHLFGRRHFFDRLDRELQTARGFQRPLSVLVIDLNGMKETNYAHGHRLGDKVLASFGRFLADQARASDVPARIGGDEFAVILPDTNEQAARSAVNRLLQALDKTPAFEENGISVKLTAAVGAAGYPWVADTVDEMMRLAGESLGAQKREQQAALSAARGAASSDHADG